MCRDPVATHVVATRPRPANERLAQQLRGAATRAAGSTSHGRGTQQHGGTARESGTPQSPEAEAATSVGAAMCLSHLTLSRRGSGHGVSTRRGLLRLAPAQVHVQPDGSPLLPMVVAPSSPVTPAPTKRFLQCHQRCEIVLRVLAGERQAHLAKEFGVSRAAVSYLLRNPWNAMRTSPRVQRERASSG